MQSAMPSSVPSPPSTTTMSTSRGERRLVGDRSPSRWRHQRGGRGLEHRRRRRARGATRRCPTRCGVAGAADATWRRCRRAGVSGERQSAMAEVQSPSGESRSPRTVSVRRCRKNSWLPVAPVIGDGRHARRARVRPPRPPAVTRASTRLVDGRIGDEPALADLVAARPRTAASRARRRRRRREERRQRRKDVAERDERDVDGHEIDRVRHVGARQARAR